MRSRYLIAGAILFAFILVLPIVKAADPFTAEESIGPGNYAAVPLIPISETESMDITIDSNVPLIVFIIDSQENYEEFIGLGEGDFENFTAYEQKYEDVTYKKITQDYDADHYYWVLLYNPSETDTADVEVEYEFFEDMTAEIVEDAVSGVCCGLTMITGVIGVIGIIAVVMMAKKR